jgi:tetratricopeptide (TPR) repeat protein
MGPMPEPPPTPGRNDPCPCGSGKRFKHCHGAASAGPQPSAEDLTRQGVAAHARGDLAEAERCYRAALALAPEHPTALHYLGVVLYQHRRLDEALPLLDRAVALVPGEPEFHNNRGLALTAAMRNVDAIAAFRRAIEIKPDHAGAWNNLGLALQDAADVTGAIAAFRRGLSLAPEFPQLHWNLALALLLQGDYREGFREYEWRLRTDELARTLTSYPGPRWTGEGPAGRTLLVTVEQGLGDAIQHLRFVQRLAAQGARVSVVVPEPLKRLAATASGVSAVCVPGDPLPEYDAHIPLMSLPGILGVTLDEVAVPVPYLRADAVRVEEASRAIAQSAGSALTVGIAWAGAPGNTHNARRSLPLAALAPLFEVPNVRLFSLKREGEALTAADAPWSKRLVSFDLRNDFDGLAALVASLDLVVSVDTSLAHLAGALGKPLWALLAFVPDWRWLMTRSDSPWYPTARLFRQRAPGDWSTPVHEVAQALRERVDGG